MSQPTSVGTSSTNAPVNQPSADSIIEVWKKTVEVQQHFNEIEMKIRNLAVTLLVGAIGAAALTLEKQMTFNLWGSPIPLAAAVLLSGLIGWTAFFSMEIYWYHVFLKATSLHADYIESTWKDLIPAFGLSKAISSASANVKVLQLIPLSSSWRLRLFYISGALVLGVMLIAVSWGHVPSEPESQQTADAAIRNSLLDATAALSRSSAALDAATKQLAEMKQEASQAIAVAQGVRSAPDVERTKPGIDAAKK
jgi:hypothetical protein